MYFWNIKALAADLKAKRLSQREVFYYFFAYMVLVAVVMEISSFVPDEATMHALASSVLVVLITIAGLIACYRANDQGDAETFVERFICLAWPISIRLMVILVLAFSFYLFAGYFLFGEAFEAFVENAYIVDIAILVIGEAVYYLWIRHHILRVSGAVQQS